jgi:hypothetical protein
MILKASVRVGLSGGLFPDQRMNITTHFTVPSAATTRVFKTFYWIRDWTSRSQKVFSQLLRRTAISK